MLDPQRYPDRLRDRLASVLWGQRCHRAAPLVSVTLALPCYQAGLPLGLPAPLLFRFVPSRGELTLGLGLAATVEAGGAGRLEALDAGLSPWLGDWRHTDADGTGLEPGAFLGFAFDEDDPMDGPWAGWPNAGVFVPEVTVRCRGNACGVTLTTRGEDLRRPRSVLERWCRLLGPVLPRLVDDPLTPTRRARLARQGTAAEAARFRRLVAAAVGAVGEGTLAKVVPARTARVSATGRLEPARVAASLAARYPTCAVWTARLGDRTLVGATPETLVSLRGGSVSSDALGGTAPLGPPGEAPVMDDEKTRHEHALVVEGLRAALAPAVDGLSVPAAPEVVRYRHLCHLRTRVRGTGRSGTTLLGLAARLHPTPAVCGTPTPAAREWLRAHGNAARGWYTGGLGWVERTGDGEIEVPLRCALVNGSDAVLYAGAGVVAGSVPAAELGETELKLVGLLEALRHG
jgi:menaquinone-specific isochorismate synthase